MRGRTHAKARIVRDRTSTCDMTAAREQTLPASSALDQIQTEEISQLDDEPSPRKWMWSDEVDDEDAQYYDLEAQLDLSVPAQYGGNDEAAMSWRPSTKNGLQPVTWSFAEMEGATRIQDAGTGWEGAEQYTTEDEGDALANQYQLMEELGSKYTFYAASR